MALEFAIKFSYLCCQHRKVVCVLLMNVFFVLRSRDITLPTKVCIVKAIVFTVTMYECEGWSIKKVEHQRIDAFELWC